MAIRELGRAEIEQRRADTRAWVAQDRLEKAAPAEVDVIERLRDDAPRIASRGDEVPFSSPFAVRADARRYVPLERKTPEIIAAPAPSQLPAVVAPRRGLVSGLLHEHVAPFVLTSVAKGVVASVDFLDRRGISAPKKILDRVAEVALARPAAPTVVDAPPRHFSERLVDKFDRGADAALHISNKLSDVGAEGIKHVVQGTVDTVSAVLHGHQHISEDVVETTVAETETALHATEKISTDIVHTFDAEAKLAAQVPVIITDAVTKSAADASKVAVTNLKEIPKAVIDGAAEVVEYGAKKAEDVADHVIDNTAARVQGRFANGMRGVREGLWKAAGFASETKDGTTTRRFSGKLFARSLGVGAAGIGAVALVAHPAGWAALSVLAVKGFAGGLVVNGAGNASVGGIRGLFARSAPATR